jgi:hypothetical protein
MKYLFWTLMRVLTRLTFRLAYRVERRACLAVDALGPVLDNLDERTADGFKPWWLRSREDKRRHLALIADIQTRLSALEAGGAKAAVGMLTGLDEAEIDALGGVGEEPLADWERELLYGPEDVRIHQLARALHFPSIDVIEEARSLGYLARSASSRLTWEQAHEIANRMRGLGVYLERSCDGHLVLVDPLLTD